MQQQKLAKCYQWLIIAIGAAICLFCISRLTLGDVNLRFFFLAAVTLGLGSRITIEIPRARGTVSVSDTFIFLAILVFGTPAAVLLAAADGFASSLRFNRKALTTAFNSAVMAVSTFVTSWSLHWAFNSDLVTVKSYSPVFVIAVCLLALVQYITNSWLVAIGAALKSEKGIWLTWKTHFLWTSITYIAGGSAAGLIAKLIESFGFY